MRLDTFTRDSRPATRDQRKRYSVPYIKGTPYLFLWSRNLTNQRVWEHTGHTQQREVVIVRMVSLVLFLLALCTATAAQQALTLEPLGGTSVARTWYKAPTGIVGNNAVCLVKATIDTSDDHDSVAWRFSAVVSNKHEHSVTVVAEDTSEGAAATTVDAEPANVRMVRQCVEEFETFVPDPSTPRVMVASYQPAIEALKRHVNDS